MLLLLLNHQDNVPYIYHLQLLYSSHSLQKEKNKFTFLPITEKLKVQHQTTSSSLTTLTNVLWSLSVPGRPFLVPPSWASTNPRRLFLVLFTFFERYLPNSLLNFVSGSPFPVSVLEVENPEITTFETDGWIPVQPDRLSQRTFSQPRFSTSDFRSQNWLLPLSPPSTCMDSSKECNLTKTTSTWKRCKKWVLLFSGTFLPPPPFLSSCPEVESKPNSQHGFKRLLPSL